MRLLSVEAGKFRAGRGSRGATKHLGEYAVMKSNRTTQKDGRAFTLIEVLLAVGVFAIVLFAINTVFFSALRLERATNPRAVDERFAAESSAGDFSAAICKARSSR